MKKETPAESGSIFDSVREGFATVARLSTHVRIREDMVPAYAAALPDHLPDNILDDDHHFSGSREETAAYYLTLDAINFGSGYKSHMAREGFRLDEGSIYFTVSTRLKEHFASEGALTAAALSRMTPEKVAVILGLDLNGRFSAEFAGLCCSSLRALGAAVETKTGGSFFSFITETAPSADRMVRRLIEMPGFNDIHDYKGHRIPFYKRAQHNVKALNTAFNRLGVPLFGDMDRLTMFADNAVARILRADGLLECSTDLENRIAREENILAGSEEEIEIRGCEGHIVKLLAAAKKMTESDIDLILWHKSVEEPHYKETPAHRTLTIFY